MKDLLLGASKVELVRVCAIESTNRQALVDRINTLIDSPYFDSRDGRLYLSVKLSGEQLGCEGCSAEYATEADVPHHSVPCPCGNPNHWLIKYNEE